MKPNWKCVVSFRTELLSEALIHRGYREDLPSLIPGIGSMMRNRMIVDNDIYVDLFEIENILQSLSVDISPLARSAYDAIEAQSQKLLHCALQERKEFDLSCSNSEIIQSLHRFFGEYQRTLGAIGIPTILDIALEKALRDELGGIEVSEKEVLLGDLAVPFKKTGTALEREDLLKISIAKQSEGDVQEMISEHAQKYGWIHSTLFLGEVYGESDILESLESISSPQEELEKIDNENQEHAGRAEKALSRFSSQRGRDLASLFRFGVYMRTARLEWMNESCFLFRPILEEAAERLDIEYVDILYLFPEEIFSCLAGKESVDKNLVQERQKGYALVSDNTTENPRLFVGEDLFNLQKSLKQEGESDFQNKEIKGQVARKGRVQGNAVLVRDRSELDKVSFGNILVTRLTTPDFVVAMRKSAGIVTDLGGITSHAAITSRELGIPCVIGTKIATQVLKDGDLVEVDADNGVVRILEK